MKKWREWDLQHKIIIVVKSITAEILQPTMKNIIKCVQYYIEHDGQDFDLFVC